MLLSSHGAFELPRQYKMYTTTRIVSEYPGSNPNNTKKTKIMQILNVAPFLLVCTEAFIGSSISARSQRKLNNFKSYWQNSPRNDTRYRYDEIEAVQKRMRVMRMNKTRPRFNPRLQKYLSHFSY